MAWIYLVASGDLDLPWHHGSDRLPTVRQNDMHKPFCSHECNTENCQWRPSGMMFGPYERFTCRRWTLCTEVSRARTSALLGAVRAWAVSGVRFIGNYTESLPNADQLSFFSKTSQQSEQEDLKKWSGHLPMSGMTVGGRVFQPPMLAHPTFENDGSSLLPTPTASRYGMNKGGRNPNGKARLSLNTMAKQGSWPMLPTPRPCSGLRSSGANRTEIMDGLKRWPTPRSSDIRGEGKGAAERRMADGAGCTLAGAVKMWPTPTVDDANNVTRKSGQYKSLTRDATNSGEIGGALNPTWVEWLMGYPLEWTVLKGAATQWFLSKHGRRSPGYSAKKRRGDFPNGG